MTLLAFLLAVLAILLAIRAILPEVIERYVNRVLDRTEGYSGSIQDIDLALYRGAYRIEGLELNQSHGEGERPLLSIAVTDLSLSWSALLRGSLVGDLVLESPRYAVVAAPPPAKETLEQTGEQIHWSEGVDALFPVRINHFEVRNGTLTYADPHRSPPVEIQFESVEAQGRNWGNIRGEEGDRFASLGARGVAFDSGRLELGLEANPLSRRPDFALDLRVRDVDLRELNEFLQAYGGFDVSSGQLGVYAEIDAEDGGFDGYVKPLVRELDVLGEDEEQSFLRDAWEGFVGALAEVLENQSKDQQGARIPVEGTFGPDLDLWAAIDTVLSNAFLDALPAGLEGSDAVLPASE